MHKKILLVDDEPEVIQLLQIVLSQEGYDVDTARNGQQALASVALHKPNLILMDEVMPVLGGIETLKLLKENRVTSDIPVVMLTANDSYADMLQSWENGSDLYLSKPIPTAQLLDYVKCILEPA